MIDTHVHFWDPTCLQYPWLDALPSLHRACLPDEYSRDTADTNISKMIFVECGCNRQQALAEVAWVSKLASEEPRLSGIVAQAALECGLDVEAELAMLATYPLVKGVRRNFEDEEDNNFCLRPQSSEIATV